MTTHLAQALEAPIDHLVDTADILIETTIVYGIIYNQNLKNDDKQHTLVLLDAFLKQKLIQAIM